MTSVTSSFYVTGGTMRADAASYVERLADRQIYKGLRGGEFCYVLTSRQMGKSSLMVRTARKLREDGFKVVVLDLTALGQNLTPEQWYTGLLLRVGQQLDLEDELEAFFQANLQVGPCQRFFTAIHKILCEHWKSARPGSKSLGLKSSSGQPDAGQSPRLVIFVDEIDTVRSLPFTTDEFFAAIRECYNRRTEEPIFNQLTFCLLGVATPSDLIKDTRVTPFNIGRRIELTDFSESEMAPLAQGLRKDPQVAAALLQRVYYWTNGHPYLTQRLCQAVAQDAAVLGPAGVNRICNELFLSLRAREQDDNLIFVRERLLRNQTDLTGLLDCYRRILIGESIRDDVTDPLQAQLRLAGITRARDGRVFVHNLIYKRVFSLEWVAANMPQAELLRQRAAFRRGLIRAASISAVVLMVMALFLAYSIRMSRLAQRSTSESRDRLVQLQIQNGAEQLRLGNLATAAPWFAEALRLEKGRATLEEPHRLRLASILQSMPRLVQVWSLETAIHDAAISPNGEWIAVALENKTARLFHIQTGAPVGPAMQHDSPVRSLAFSPDGRWLVTGAEDPSARIWELGRNRAMEPPLKQDSAVGVGVVRYSPNGRWIVTGTMNGTARIWDATSGEPVGKPMQHEGEVSDAIFSPNNLWVAVAWRMPDKPGAAGVWNAQTGEPVTAWLEHTKGVRRLAFSPDGKMLATACEDFHVYVWNLPEGKQSVPPLRHYSWVVSATFSPDGEKLITGALDGPVAVWDLKSGQMLNRPMLHSGWIGHTTASPDGNTVMTARALSGMSSESEIQFWNAADSEALTPPLPHTGRISAARFSSDGRLAVSACVDGTLRVWDLSTVGPRSFAPEAGGQIAVCSQDAKRILAVNADGTARVWDMTKRQPISAVLKHAAAITAAAFSQDGELVLTGSDDRTARFWRAASGDAFSDPIPHDDKVRQVAFSPDGTHALTVSVDHAVRVIQLQPKLMLQHVLTHADYVQHAEFSPDNARILTACSDGHGRLWSVRSGQVESRTLAHARVVSKAHFNLDGSRIVTTSFDRTARVWDAATGRPITEPLEHPLLVWDAQFSPDHRFVATACKDGHARIWEIATGSRVSPPMIHRSDVEVVQYHPGGRYLLTSSMDGTARVWESATGLPMTPLLQGLGPWAKFSPDGRWIFRERYGRELKFHAFQSDDIPVEDWIAIAELISERRLDATGSLTALPVLSNRTNTSKSIAAPGMPADRTLRELWDYLRQKYPGRFGPLNDRAKALQR